MNAKNSGWCVGTLAVVGGLLASAEGRADTFAARVTVTGTTDATTMATVVQQSPGHSLAVATSPANLGDLSLLLDGNPLAQANGVIIPAPNQMRYTAVGDRNMIEVPGELTATIPAGFPTGMWLSTAKVSGAGGIEDNFNFSMVHFPFADGWVAGHVTGTSGSLFAGNGGGVSITTQFGIPSAGFGNGHYKLSISGVDSRASGMIFATGGANATSGNVVPVGILPDGSGWDVRVNDQNLNFPATEQANWSFVYVPYNTANLVAAGNLSLDGTAFPGTVGILSSVGAFTAERVDLGVNGTITPPTAPDGLIDAGRFLIKITGKDDTTGVLLIGVSKYATAGGEFGADDNFLTYEYNSTLGGFLVETYDLTGAGLQDSDIYFAYLDYANSIAVPEPSVLALSALAALALGTARRRSSKSG